LWFYLKIEKMKKIFNKNILKIHKKFYSKEKKTNILLLISELTNKHGIHLKNFPTVF
jgi:hypothetical protein